VATGRKMNGQSPAKTSPLEKGVVSKNHRGLIITEADETREMTVITEKGNRAEGGKNETP